MIQHSAKVQSIFLSLSSGKIENFGQVLLESKKVREGISSSNLNPTLQDGLIGQLNTLENSFMKSFIETALVDSLSQKARASSNLAQYAGVDKFGEDFSEVTGFENLPPAEKASISRVLKDFFGSGSPSLGVVLTKEGSFTDWARLMFGLMGVGQEWAKEQFGQDSTMAALLDGQFVDSIEKNAKATLEHYYNQDVSAYSDIVSLVELTILELGVNFLESDAGDWFKQFGARGLAGSGLAEEAGEEFYKILLETTKRDRVLAELNVFFAPESKNSK